MRAEVYCVSPLPVSAKSRPAAPAGGTNAQQIRGISNLPEDALLKVSGPKREFGCGFSDYVSRGCIEMPRLEYLVSAAKFVAIKEYYEQSHGAQSNAALIRLSNAPVNLVDDNGLAPGDPPQAKKPQEELPPQVSTELNEKRHASNATTYPQQIADAAATDEAETSGARAAVGQAPSLPASSALLDADDERETLLLSQAKRQLSEGTIVVGERHDRANAREFAMSLISGGHVSDLFLELADLSSDTFGGDDPDQLFSEHLNSLGASDVRADPLFQYFAQVSGSMTGAQRNSKPLPEFMAFARTHGVRVHLIDNAITKKKRAAEKLIERNIGMAASFNEVGSAAKPGGVILVGANHCAPGRTDSLPALCRISPQSVYDLSR
jgi:hypothetical protein